MATLSVHRSSALGLSKLVALRISKCRTPLTPRSAFVAMLLHEARLWQEGSPSDELEVIHPAFWTLCPPSER